MPTEVMTLRPLATDYGPETAAALEPLPWYAIRVKPNFEKRVANAFKSKGLEECLPLYKARRRWSDRFKTIECPLFAGYVFCRLDMDHRLPILSTPGFLYIVSVGKRPVAVDESEMATIQSVMRSGLPALPWPSLAVGERVRVETGPLRGLEGFFTQMGKQNRMCVCLTLLKRGVSVEVDRDWIRPVSGKPRTEHGETSGDSWRSAAAGKQTGGARLTGKGQHKPEASMKIPRLMALCVTGLFLAAGAWGQVTSARAGAPAEVTPATANVSKVNCGSQVRSMYLLGPDDELDVSAPELDGPPNKTVRVDGQGDVQVPLVGRVHVAGLTVQQAEDEVNKLLRTYIRDPQVSIGVKELRSQPVSVLGAVNAPGVQQVQGHKTLLEMISMAGGTRPDAGYSIRITRRREWGCIPLPNTTVDASGQFSMAEVNLQDIIGAKTPEENIQIFPHDVISVPKAELIYVIGDVKKSGGFVLGQHESMSVLQALSMAEGLNGTADTKHAKILRADANADKRMEIPVDVKSIVNGKSKDVPLEGDDILFIPGSAGKKVALRTLEAAIQTGTGVIIWHY